MCELEKCEEEQTSVVHKQPDCQLFCLSIFPLDLSQTCETFTISKDPSSLSPLAHFLFLFSGRAAGNESLCCNLAPLKAFEVEV